MDHPVMVVPEAMAALHALGAAIGDCGVPHRTVELVNFRASQINGCSVCLEGGARDAAKAGESPDRLLVLAGWRDTPFFTEAERAALALTEAVTRLADRAEPVPDEVWAEAARHYDQRALAGLVLQIANINVWNRLNVATRQLAGTYTW
jgi:AhpD family alkylhydroperoxidase